MSQKSYECRQCHKMTVGYPALYRNQCLECRNLDGERTSWKANENGTNPRKQKVASQNAKLARH